MITVKVTRFENGNISGFTVKGHAGYAEAGRDIVCAAVSAICYTAAGYFESNPTYGSRTEFAEEDGYMKFHILEAGDGLEPVKAGAVMDAWLTGLLQIRESYGEKYLKIVEE